MGSQFTLEFPLVDDQEKKFNVGINMFAEKGVKEEKQAAELKVDLMGQQGSLISGELSKGNVAGQWRHNITKSLSYNGNFVNQTALSHMSHEAHVKLKDCTMSLGYDVISRDQTEQSVSASYLQSIAPKLALGVQCKHMRVDMQAMTEVSFMGNYKNLKGNKMGGKEGNVVTTFLNPTSLNVGYTRMMLPGIALVSDFTAQKLPPGNPYGKPYISSCAAGCRYYGQTFQYHFNLDSSGTFKAHLLQLNQLGHMILSGQMNHWTHESRFGIGFKFTPPKY